MPYSTPAGPGHQPFEAVLAQLTMRPGMIEHLEGIDLDDDGVPDMPLGQPNPQMLAHPMGRMQWQALMLDRQHKMRTAHQRRAQRKEINNQVLLAHLKANDPLFAQVHAKVGEFVRTLTPKLQRPFLRAVEETPGAYLDLYKEMRDLVKISLRLGGRGARKSGPHDQRVKARDGDERQAEAARSAERAALVKRVKAGGAREGDLLRYLELCGVKEPRTGQDTGRASPGSDSPHTSPQEEAMGLEFEDTNDITQGTDFTGQGQAASDPGPAPASDNNNQTDGWLLHRTS